MNYSYEYNGMTYISSHLYEIRAMTFFETQERPRMYLAHREPESVVWVMLLLPTNYTCLFKAEFCGGTFQCSLMPKMSVVCVPCLQQCCTPLETACTAAHSP